MRLATDSIAFTNISGDGPYLAKARRVLALLSAHPTIAEYLSGRQCDIVLEKRLLGAPADIVDTGPVVTVTLAAYYFEQYDLGYVVGMLCHEFGVHHLAGRVPGIDAEERAMAGAVRVPCLGGTSVNAGTARERDHAFAAIDTGLRHSAYRTAVLAMANLLLADARADVAGARSRDVTDLLDCYLMDLASIAATNDRRLLGLPGRSGSVLVRAAIAVAYQGYKTALGNDQELNPDLAAYFPPDKSANAVYRDYKTLAGRALKGFFGAPSIS